MLCRGSVAAFFALTLHSCAAIKAEAHHLVLCQVDIDTVEKFEALRETEKQYFLDMVKQCKDSGATLIICQWHALAFSTLHFERTLQAFAVHNPVLKLWLALAARSRQIYLKWRFIKLWLGATGALTTRQTTC